MGTIVKLNTVQEYNMAMGVETLHPLVSEIGRASCRERV